MKNEHYFEIQFSKSINFMTFIYSWNIRIVCYVKVWKYIIEICSLVLRRGFLNRYAILVIWYLSSLSMLFGLLKQTLKHIYWKLYFHKINTKDHLYSCSNINVVPFKAFLLLRQLHEMNGQLYIWNILKTLELWWIEWYSNSSRKVIEQKIRPKTV